MQNRHRRSIKNLQWQETHAKTYCERHIVKDNLFILKGLVMQKITRRNPLASFGASIVAASFAAMLIWSATSGAEEVAVDLTKVKKVAVEHIESLAKFEQEKIDKLLKEKGAFAPFGAFMLVDERLKELDLGKNEQVLKAPAEIQIAIYRQALRALARHDTLFAGAVFYTTLKDKDPNQRLLVMEFEHKLGVSGMRVTPYEIEKDGKVLLGQPKDLKKPFEFFYDDKSTKKAAQ